MNSNIIYNKILGNVLRLETSDSPPILISAEEGVLPCTYSECIDKLDSHYVDLNTKELVPYPPKPHNFSQFNYLTLKWVDPRSLEQIKEAKWEEIKAKRTNAEYAGFTWDGSYFDSDATSQNRINGAVTLALLSLQNQQPYEITWSLANRTFRTLTAQEMISVGLALGTHVQTNFNKGQALQVQIDAATTKEEVDAIHW